MYAALVTGLNEQLDVRIHERYRHSDCRTVRQYEIRILTELLDYAENVVPSATVQTSGMVAKLIDDLFTVSGT